MTEWLVRRFLKNPEQTQEPAVRERYGLLSGVVGIVLNLLLAAGKLFAGLAFSSISITADALNNLTDAGSSVVTLVGFRLAGQKADAGHPFGHGRIEYLAGLLVSLLILLVGVELGRSSIEKILRPEAVIFSWISVAILGVSICVKLWMSHFNRTLARRIGSAAMAAVAADSLSDVAATAAVLAGTLIGHISGVQIDGWAGIVVAVFILRAGWGAAKDTLNPLLGQSPDPGLVTQIRAAVMAHPQVVGIHDLIIHDYGPGRAMMSLHAEIRSDADMLASHDVIDAIERELKARFHIDTTIHMDPIATDDAHINRVRLQVAELARTIDPGISIHDFRMTAGPRHTNLIFDAAVPHQCPLTDEQVSAALARAVKELDLTYYTVIQIDRVYT